MFDFTGKTVLVTGGAQGIGKEIVRGVVNGGGHAVILDLNEEKAKATAAELGNCSVYKIDLGDKDNIRAVMAKILGDFERVDVLINCGGVISKVPFQELTDEEWERTLRINLTGTFTTCSAIYPYFIEKIGGGLLGTAAYATSKAGVNGLTKAIAKEGGKYGISCNAVCPSFTVTPMTQSLSEDAEKSAKVIGMIPLGRAADPSEPAQMILFFASEAASFVNGEIGDCDGGIVLD